MKTKPPMKIEELTYLKPACGLYSFMEDKDGNLYLVCALDSEEDAQPKKAEKASEVRHVMTWGDTSKTGPKEG